MALVPTPGWGNLRRVGSRRPSSLEGGGGVVCGGTVRRCGPESAPRALGGPATHAARCQPDLAKGGTKKMKEKRTTDNRLASTRHHDMMSLQAAAQLGGDGRSHVPDPEKADEACPRWPPAQKSTLLGRWSAGAAPAAAGLPPPRPRRRYTLCRCPPGGPPARSGERAMPPGPRAAVTLSPGSFWTRRRQDHTSGTRGGS